MESELGRELLETMKELKENIKLLHGSVEDRLEPCFCIMAALVKGLPTEEQKNLLALLQSVSESIEPLAQAENIESSYSKAVKIVSALVSRYADEPSSVQSLQLILGGKTD